MDALLGFVAWYPLYGVPTWLAIGLTRILLRSRLQFGVGDWGLSILPWTVWFTLAVSLDSGKSLTNVAVEGLGLGCVGAASFVIRGLLGWVFPVWQGTISHGASLIACVAAVLLWSLVPLLPE